MRSTSGSRRRLLRPEIGQLPAYAAPQADAPIRLDRNESPEEPSLELRQRVLSELAAARWSRYPDPHAAALKNAIARRECLSPGSVIVANGSNALFFSLFVAIASPGRRVALCPPTFGLYDPWIRGAGGEPRPFPLAERDLSPPLEEMLSAAADDPDLAFVVCSPNNPTGTLFPREGLVALAGSGALVIVDEAYAEFSGSTARDLLPRFRNLVLVRTMSKAMALAGARIGYMLGSAEVLAEVEKLLPPYSVNLFARAAAEASLADEDGIRERVRAIVAERERMARALEGLAGARISASAANFLYLRPERPAAELFEQLRRRGILVRRVAGTGAEALRVTVGRPAENDRFVQVWKEVVA